MADRAESEIGSEIGRGIGTGSESESKGKTRAGRGKGRGRGRGREGRRRGRERRERGRRKEEGERGKGKTIILGLGNLLLGDEGVGVHVIRQLRELELSAEVELIDGGTAGIDLLPLLEGAERVIIVDAVRAGGQPGSIYRFGPEALWGERDRDQDGGQDQDDEDERGRAPCSYGPPVSLHQLSLGEVLHMGKLLGMDISPKITIIGVEPKRVAPRLGLSQELEEALPQVVALILEELAS